MSEFTLRRIPRQRTRRGTPGFDVVVIMEYMDAGDPDVTAIMLRDYGAAYEDVSELELELFDEHLVEMSEYANEVIVLSSIGVERV